MSSYCNDKCKQYRHMYIYKNSQNSKQSRNTLIDEEKKGEISEVL